MAVRAWHGMSLQDRVAWLRRALPLVIFVFVIFYQLLFVESIHESYSLLEHYISEILFYGLIGPLVTWVTLAWIGRWLAEKERVEQQMRERERYLASITDASADAIISLDQQGIVQSWNRGAELIFGYRADQFVGKPFAALVPVDRRERGELGSVEREVSKEGFIRDYETELLAHSGRRVPVELTRALLTDERKQVTGSAVVIRDITERRRRERAVLDERARIAREIHEGIAQNLFFLGLKIDLCRKLTPSDRDRWDRELGMIKATLQDSIADLRRVIWSLRPVDLEALGVYEAVRKLASEFGSANGLSVQVAVLGEERKLPFALEATLYRFVQECLNNILKHSQAHNAWIDLDLRSHDEIALSVRDDGRGFDASGVLPQTQGLGLRHLRERVEEAGGLFSIEAAPGMGARVAATIPLKKVACT